MSKQPETPPQQPPAPASAAELKISTEESPRSGEPQDAPSSPMHQQNLALEFVRPRTREQMQACMQRSTGQAIQQVLDSMFGEGPEAPKEFTPEAFEGPKLPTIKPGDAILRINYALLDANGIAFSQDLDIPLPTFARPSMLPMAIKTVQAALSTLVLSPLYGAVTDYVEGRTAASAHSEVPLPFRLKQADIDPVTGEPTDLEGRDN